MVSGIRVAAVTTQWHALGNCNFKAFAAVWLVSFLPGCGTASLGHSVLVSLSDETTILSRNVGD
jgi:hypothetical protein